MATVILMVINNDDDDDDDDDYDFCVSFQYSVGNAKHWIVAGTFNHV